MAVSVQFDKNISICSIYLPPEGNYNTEELTNLFLQIPPPRLIMRDFNADFTTWGSTKDNHRGKVIETLLENESLMLLNSGKITRFNARSGNFSAIHLSLCYRTQRPYLTWEISPGLYDSDQYPIIIKSYKSIKQPPRYIKGNMLKHRYFWQMYTHGHKCRISLR